MRNLCQRWDIFLFFCFLLFKKMYKGHSSSPAVCMCVLWPWRPGLRLNISSWNWILSVHEWCYYSVVPHYTQRGLLSLISKKKIKWSQGNVIFSPLFAYSYRKKVAVNFLLKCFFYWTFQRPGRTWGGTLLPLTWERCCTLCDIMHIFSKSCLCS